MWEEKIATPFFHKCKVTVYKYGSLIKFAVRKVFEEHYANKILIIADCKCHQSACLKGEQNAFTSPLWFSLPASCGKIKKAYLKKIIFNWISSSPSLLHKLFPATLFFPITILSTKINSQSLLRQTRSQNCKDNHPFYFVH